MGVFRILLVLAFLLSLSFSVVKCEADFEDDDIDVEDYETESHEEHASSSDKNDASAEPRAIVLLRNSIIDSEGGLYLVEDKEFVVEYAVYNVGDIVATDISIEDSWPAANVELKSGAFPIVIEELAPGASFLTNITFKAIAKGPFATNVSIAMYSCIMLIYIWRNVCYTIFASMYMYIIPPVLVGLLHPSSILIYHFI